MAYAPTSSLTALDTAVTTLRTERDAAQAGGFPAIAAMLEQAAARVAAGRDRVAGAIQTNAWTAERAVAALAAQSVPARARNGEAIVELTTGGRLVIAAYAQAFPGNARPGYAIAIVGPLGETATTVRAADDQALATVVGRLYS